MIVDEVGADKVWVVANSLGGQVVADAFSDLHSKGNWSDVDTEIEHVVLTAADSHRSRRDRPTALARNPSRAKGGTST